MVLSYGMHDFMFMVFFFSMSCISFKNKDWFVLFYLFYGMLDFVSMFVYFI
jgi:hypothetical protein